MGLSICVSLAGGFGVFFVNPQEVGGFVNSFLHFVNGCLCPYNL